MNEFEILKKELRQLTFPTMKMAKEAVIYLRTIENDRSPTVYDLLKFAGRETEDWYKAWGWQHFTYALLGSRYGATAKRDGNRKITHFYVRLPPPKPVSLLKNPPPRDW